MDFFKAQSEVFKDIKGSVDCDDTFNVDVGMTRDIADDITKIMNGKINDIKDDIKTLKFAHFWRMQPLYDTLRKYVKCKIIDNAYVTDILITELNADIFKDMFNTRTDIEALIVSDLLDIWKTIYEKSCQDNAYAELCAECGYLDGLRFLFKNGVRFIPWVCIKAARNGHLDCLMYAFQNGCSTNREVCSEAAKNGHFDCMVYAWNNFAENDLKCVDAAKGGNLACLQFAIDVGCHIDEASICATASQEGHLNILQYAYEKKFCWDVWTCNNAAEEGHFECLKFAHENGCTWSYNTCALAAKRDHLDCIVYARENGCPWDSSVVNYAVQHNHFDCLKYAVENGCEVTIDACEIAYDNDNTKCLEYLKTYIDWDEMSYVQYRAEQLQTFLDDHAQYVDDDDDDLHRYY